MACHDKFGPPPAKWFPQILNIWTPPSGTYISQVSWNIWTPLKLLVSHVSIYFKIFEPPQDIYFRARLKYMDHPWNGYFNRTEICGPLELNSNLMHNLTTAMYIMQPNYVPVWSQRKNRVTVTDYNCYKTIWWQSQMLEWVHLHKHQHGTTPYIYYTVSS